LFLARALGSEGHFCDAGAVRGLPLLLRRHLRGGGREVGGVSSVFFRTAPGMARSNYWVPMKRSQRTEAARATYDKNGATSAAGVQVLIRLIA
jgi:hypothetical protein